MNRPRPRDGEVGTATLVAFQYWVLAMKGTRSTAAA